MVKSRSAVVIGNVRIGSLGEQPFHFTDIAAPGGGVESSFLGSSRPDGADSCQQQQRCGNKASYVDDLFYHPTSPCPGVRQIYEM